MKVPRRRQQGRAFRPEQEPTSTETPEAELAAREVAAACRPPWPLPEDRAKPCCCARSKGLSYDEIAAAMGTPIGTVRSRIFRAREAVSARVRPLLENQSGKRW